MTKNNASAQLLPKSHTGQRFIAKFGEHLRFIEAENPYVSQATGKRKKGFGKKVETNWRTEKKYRLRPRALWRRFNNPKEVIGVNFGTYTDRVVIDVDSGLNPYHPSFDEGAFKNLLGTFELIGLCRPIFLRSSWSDGLHVYFFFAKKVKTFDVACAMEGALREAGIKPKSGQVELFPNVKGYNSYYKAHRLPLQPGTGATILNQDYQPYSDDLNRFLEMADRTAEYQDMELLEAACEKYRKVITFERCIKSKDALKKFERDLLDEYGEGYTAPGQTNNLLLTIACYGVVFMGLDEEVGIEPLADYIEETITGLDGYEQYCNHKHEIRKRCLEVAKSSQAYYWAAGKPRKRQRTFVDNFGKFLAGVTNSNDAIAANTKQRLQTILAAMEQANEPVPQTQKGFIAFLIAKSQAAFDVGFSPSTLRKAGYKSLWLPVFNLLLAVQLTAQPATATPIIKPEVIAINQQVEPEAIAPTPEPQQKLPNNQFQREVIKLAAAVLEADIDAAINKPAKNAETRTNKGGDTPSQKIAKVKTLKPAQTKAGTHLALYGGFGKREAQLSENLKNPSPQFEAISIASQPSLALTPPQSAQSSKLALKSQRSPSQHSTPRPVTKSDAAKKLALEQQQREKAYLEHMQQLRASQKALEDELKTPEYKSTAKQGFDAIRRILGRSRANLKGGTPSPPT